MKKTVKILWTGGYDSTYRVMELSRLDLNIQPYYLSDNRQSEKYELDSISKIMKKLQEHAGTCCSILPLIIIGKKDRDESLSISSAYKRIYKKIFFGSQYEWLACFAKENKGIELSIHQDDKAMEIIEKCGGLVQVNMEVVGENYILDTSQSNEDMVLIFGDFMFPLAYKTKLDMKEDYINWGYEDIMNDTWFCHTPHDGKPCGICNPCKYTIEEGLKERFTKKALIRYRVHNIISMIRKK